MNKTKDTIRDFIGKTGHHDTTVHESVEPAVKRETVKPTEREDVTTAVKKEVHQDHYHRTVQPVQDREVLPEQHQQKVGSTQHREFDHRDHEGTKKTIAAENEKFKDKRTVKDTVRTETQAPTVLGEHVHHHIHETVQPVIHKETIQPSVVHTTIPVHETHHNTAQHHNTTSLPPVSMGQFKQQVGTVGAHQERYDAFEGEPSSIRGAISSMHDKDESVLKNPPAGVFHGDFDPLDGGKGQHVPGGLQSGKTIGTGVNQNKSAQSKVHAGGKSAREDVAEHESPSLLDKLNPMIDSTGQGNPGFMK